MLTRRTKTLHDVIVIEPDVFADDRGFFMETYHQRKLAECGIDAAFVQDNHSRSRHGTLRGLHYQLHSPQAKLVRVVRGEMLDVVVDIRRGSPTFGRHCSVVLSESNRLQVYVPEGFAHGFLTLSEDAEIIYKCSQFYRPDDQFGIAWDDPELAIDWPEGERILSEKDRLNPGLRDAWAHLPSYESVDDVAS